MGRLRERQEIQNREAEAARRRLAERQVRFERMTVASSQRQYEDSIRARWTGGPSVLAFLFVHPDCDAVRMLDARGAYFDQRTGDTWDLFFPGYYRSRKGRDFEDFSGARPVGRDYGGDWYFNARDFNELREHVERSSGGVGNTPGGLISSSSTPGSS